MQDSCRYQAPTCPRCGNRDSYVVGLEPAISRPDLDILDCHCGKCNHKFEAIRQRVLQAENFPSGIAAQNLARRVA